MKKFILLLALIWPGLLHAGYRITPTGCVNANQEVTIRGDNFGPTKYGEIHLLAQPQPKTLQVLGWSNSRVRVKLPKTGLTKGTTYDLSWGTPGRPAVALGEVTLCQSSSANRTRAPRDVVPAPDKSPEYIVTVSTAQAQAAINALEGEGATLLRTRAIPQLGQTLLMLSFPGDLDLPEARSLLGIAAPTAVIDLHHIYGFAAGPRLYAAAMIGDTPGQVCNLPRTVAVGIIDGPVNSAHAALKGVQVVRHSVLLPSERRTDTNHGTAVAGLIAGHPSAGPLTGIAPGARIYAAEAFASSRTGQGARLENVAAGLDWLLTKKVRIVNMSMSGQPNRVFGHILSRAKTKGMVIVAAAGNERSNKPRLPAASPDTIAVTAVDAAQHIYSKANSGKHIEFAAPGVDVWAAKGSGGGYRSGTSYAAPIVTALLARQAARSGLSLATARQTLRRGVLDLGPTGRDSKFGHGLVQTQTCRR